MSKIIEDPGPILDPGKGNGAPVIIHKAEFSKVEFESFDDAITESPELQETLQQFAQYGADGEIDIVRLLLPAVQGSGGGFEFLKVEWTPEDSDAFISAYKEGAFDDFGNDLLLPAVQAADEAFDKSTPKLMLKIDGIDGEVLDAGTTHDVHDFDGLV